MAVDRELTKRIARDLIPKRVLISQSIVLLDNFLDEANNPNGKSSSVSAQLKGPTHIGTNQLLIEGLPAIEFLYETGYRLVPHQHNSEDSKDQSLKSDTAKPEAETEPEPLALIALNMRLIMLKAKDREYSEDELNDFGQSSGAFQIWPYFREFIHSAFVRAGLDTPPVSMFVLRD